MEPWKLNKIEIFVDNNNNNAVGNWTNDNGLSFNPDDLAYNRWLKRLVNNHLITRRAAPEGNLANKHLVSLTVPLPCHWLLSELKPVKVLTALHLTSVYFLAEVTQ